METLKEILLPVITVFGMEVIVLLVAKYDKSNKITNFLFKLVELLKSK